MMFGIVLFCEGENLSPFFVVCRFHFLYRSFYLFPTHLVLVSFFTETKLGKRLSLSKLVFLKAKKITISFPPNHNTSSVFAINIFLDAQKKYPHNETTQFPLSFLCVCGFAEKLTEKES